MKKSLLLLFIILLLTGLACQLPFQLNKQAPASSTQFSYEAAETVDILLDEIENQSGQFAFTITEEELTSYLTLKSTETQDDFIFDNIYTSFDDEKISLTGDLSSNKLGIQVPAELVITAEIDSNGKLFFVLESVNLGKITFSDSLEETISTTLNELLTNNITNHMVGVSIDTIYIDNGMLTVSGYKY